MAKKVSKSFVKAMEKQFPKGATVTPKKPMKKADGGVVSNLPTTAGGGSAGGINYRPGMRPPVTRPGRPLEGGPMPPVAKPPHIIAKPIGPATPMRRAKGGEASKEKWIQGAIKKPGALRSALGAKKGEPIPVKKLEKAASSKNPKMAKRANLAMTLRGMKKK